MMGGIKRQWQDEREKKRMQEFQNKKLKSDRSHLGIRQQSIYPSISSWVIPEAGLLQEAIPSAAGGKHGSCQASSEPGAR